MEVRKEITVLWAEFVASRTVTWVLSLALFFSWACALALTLGAVGAIALSIWRFGADIGGARTFFISNGLFSRYQIWLVIAVCSHGCALVLERWVEKLTPIVLVRTRQESLAPPHLPSTHLQTEQHAAGPYTGTEPTWATPLL